MIEGIDYSRIPYPGSPSVPTLKANGVKLVGRYAVGDISDVRLNDGRGISAAEYARMHAADIDVLIFWESSIGWMNGGYDAGAYAAADAIKNLRRAGMPDTTPIHFAYDDDPITADLEAVRFCVEGAASVVDWPRMAIYGGWGIIEHLSGIYDKIRYWSQTLAWMYGHGWHPKATTHQYAFNWWLDGTNCDRLRATVPDFGQARVVTPPPAPPEPVYPKPWLPDGWEQWAKDPNATVKRVQGPDGNTVRFRPVRIKLVLRQPTIPRTQPTLKSAYAGEKLPAGTKLHSAFIVDNAESAKTGAYFVQRDDGTYITGAKCSPKLEITPW